MFFLTLSKTQRLGHMLLTLSQATHVTAELLVKPTLITMNRCMCQFVSFDPLPSDHTKAPSLFPSQTAIYNFQNKILFADSLLASLVSYIHHTGPAQRKLLICP